MNMENKLAILMGPENSKDVVISTLPYLIGRCRTANFIIAHVNVSRNHCEILKENDVWKINDFSSSGTFVNGTLVGKSKSKVLQSGDSIRFGQVENNLCWTFCPINSDLVDDLVVKPQLPEVLGLCNENSTLKGTNSCNNVIHSNDKLDDNLCKEQKTTLENPVLKSTENSNEILLNECNKVKSEENPDKPQTVKEVTCDTKINNNEEIENKKIEELMKELQQVQNALSDLEKKNSALQGKLAAEAKDTSECSAPAKLVENLTDLMETELQCTICSELFLTAVTLSCTHTFCKYCIDLWKKKQKTCPICRKKITNETRSLVVDNYIDKMVENLSTELKLRREAIMKERANPGPAKKRTKVKR